MNDRYLGGLDNRPPLHEVLTFRAYPDIKNPVEALAYNNFVGCVLIESYPAGNVHWQGSQERNILKRDF